MKIIDMRIVPPYGGMADSPQFLNYNHPATKAFRASMRLGEDLSASNKSMSDFIFEMDSLGIEKAVVIHRRSFQDDREIADVKSLLYKYPGRFLDFLHIETVDAAGAVAEIEKYIMNGPCSGVYLEPGFRLSRIVMHGDDPRIFPIYDLCQSASIPVILQYGGGVNSTEFYTPADIDRIMGEFPHLTMAIAHGGWPQVMSFCHQAYRHKNVYLLTDCYFTGYPGSRDYIEGANGILRDKIMFGSCYPGYPMRDAVENYLHSGVRDDVLPQIMRENAVRFLKLDAKSSTILPDAHIGFDYEKTDQ